MPCADGVFRTFGDKQTFWGLDPISIFWNFIVFIQFERFEVLCVSQHRHACAQNTYRCNKYRSGALLKQCFLVVFMTSSSISSLDSDIIPVTCFEGASECFSPQICFVLAAQSILHATKNVVSIPKLLDPLELFWFSDFFR